MQLFHPVAVRLLSKYDAVLRVVEHSWASIKWGAWGATENVASVSAFIGHPDLWYGITQGGAAESGEILSAGIGVARSVRQCVAPGPTFGDVRAVAAVAQGWGATKGNPRKVNKLAMMALRLAAARKVQMVDAALLLDATGRGLAVSLSSAGPERR